LNQELNLKMPIENTYNRILAYLKGMLSNRQRHDLEKEMMRDVFDEEAFEGLSQLSEKELQADMALLENRLQNRIQPHKKRNLHLFVRLAAGILLFAGLTGTFYVIFKAPSDNLITKEESVTTESKSITPLEPLKETHAAPPATNKMDMPDKPATVPEKVAKPSTVPEKAVQPVTIPEKEEKMAAVPVTGEESAVSGIDTIFPPVDMLALEEVEIVSVTDKKMKSIDKPLTNVAEPDTRVKTEQALQGKAAGVQVSSRSADKAIEPGMDQVYPKFTKPVPPGGSLNAFKKWVDGRLDYPSYKNYPGNYKITVEIMVHANGTISNIRIGQGIPDIIAADLKKVISQRSGWTPALNQDTAVDADIKIHFVITVE
jgi:outer membrane biosynthesis protein TonB